LSEIVRELKSELGRSQFDKKQKMRKYLDRD
jgi:hypothetical protein